MSKIDQVWFTSSFFRVEPGEDDEVNPGKYGKALAEWVADQLRKRGVAVGEVFPEDWGWCVMVSGQSFSLWVGCGNEDGSKTRWLLFPAAERGISQRLFKTVDTAPALSELKNHIAEIVRTIPDVRDVEWE